MQLTRIYLRNYRVFEDELTLELPGGLVGVYGPNGAGKSYLIESIRWTLFGQSRTAKEQVRTSGVNGDCVTEIEFEHEGHLYEVRRTLSGINATVRAEASADRLQVAEGATDVSRYVHSVLGMDDTAFRASVFAEQSQLAAFTSQTAAKRRELVLRLLGITPLDGARAQANKDATQAGSDHNRLRDLLPDLAALDVEIAELAGIVVHTESARTSAVAARDAAAATRSDAEAALELLDAQARRHDTLVADGRAVRAELDAATETVTRLTAELATLDDATIRLDSLRSAAASLPALEAEVALARAVAEAEARLEDTPTPVEPPALDEPRVLARRADVEQLQAAVATLDGQRQAANAELARARAAVERAAELSDDADCPVCGQALGESFAQVQQHRAAEVTDAEARLATLDANRSTAGADLVAAETELAEAEGVLAAGRKVWAEFEAARARRLDAEATLTRANAALGRHLAQGELDQLLAALAEGRAATAEASRLEGRLERRAGAEAELAHARQLIDLASQRRAALLAEVEALAFDPKAHAAAGAAREAARAAADDAAKAAHRCELTHTEAVTRLEGARARQAVAHEQHQAIAEVAERARHLSRTAELLGAFRTSVVETVGPRLAAQAAELFAELTDHEYDRLDVDAEHFGLQIHDGGVAYDLGRFSGSEKDLANLALRVAISEQVRFQSGGAVGLLVLDEVFGPLDDERRARALLALERLRSRFRQVLVVTHATDVKEQLPAAIEVVKLPGRRATAHLVGT